jgi:hypothetical protein
MQQCNISVVLLSAFSETLSQFQSSPLPPCSLNPETFSVYAYNQSWSLHVVEQVLYLEQVELAFGIKRK